jgi:hypothetical protein
MKSQIRVEAGADPIEIPLDEGTVITSVVGTPTAGATFTMEYSCTPQGKKYVPVWVPIPDFTAATTQQTVKLSGVCRLKVEVTGTNECVFDINQAG